MTATQPRLDESRFDGCPLTEDELMALPDDGHKYELVDGRAKVVPTGGRHGFIGTFVSFRLANAGALKLGALFDSSTGFRMRSSNVRSPDVAFMRWERLPDGIPVGFIPGAADLCVEIISASEDRADAARKVGEYFDSGARLVWQMYPDIKSIRVFRSLTDDVLLGPDVMITADTLLPDFNARVADLFGPMR